MLHAAFERQFTRLMQGELLDVDAYTGGFNLQIAWSTGRAAGQAAAERVL